MTIKYLRYEPTKDELLSNPDYAYCHKQLSKKKDVVIYDSMESAETRKDEGRWMWYYKSKPNKNRKIMIFSYVKCNIVWLPTI